MGTQGTGRKRSTNKDRTTAEDDALNLIAREAEARLAAKRAARAEAREIRMKELERQQKELSDEDEQMSVGSKVEDGNYHEKGSRAASALTASTLTSLGGTSSRRGSGETAVTLDAETSLREIKDKLTETEEKYRKAMVSNAQLDNEKNNFMYQLDTLKDSLMELEELLSESRREYEDKVKECEREKHAHTVLQFQFSELKETLKQSEELLNKHGIVLGPDLNINGEVETVNDEESSSGDTAPQTNQESPMSPVSPMSPTEGSNSMLGNTEEEAKDTTKEETEPVQSQEIHDQNEGSHFCNMPDVPDVSNDEQAKPKSEDFNEISDAVGMELHKMENSIVVDEPMEHKDNDDQESREPEDIQNDAIQPTFKDRLIKADEVDGAQITKSEKQMETAVNEDFSTKDDVKPVCEPIAVAPKLQQDFEKLDDSANVDSEDVSAKSQSTSTGGKKKKRKKRGKKKGGHSDEKKEQNIEPEKAKNTTLESVESENTGLLTQSNAGLSPNSQSLNTVDEEKINTEINNVDAAKYDTKQTGEQAQPISGVANDDKMNSLTEKADQLEPMEKVTVVDTNTTSLEKEKSIDVEDTLSTTNLEESESTSKIESLENTTFLETGAQDVQTEVGAELHAGNDTDVANIDTSKSNDNPTVIEQMLKVSGVETCNSIPSEQPSTSLGQEEKSKSNVGNNDNCKNANLDIEKTLPPVAQDEILNKKESPKLENVSQNEESIAEVALTTETIDRVHMEKTESETAVIGEDKKAENIVVEEPEKGDDIRDASGAVEVHTKTLENSVEVEVEVETSNTREESTKNELYQNVDNDKLDTPSKESQSSAEGVTVHLSECSIEDTEMEIALSGGEFKRLEEQVEVGVEVLVEVTAKDQTSESKTRNVEDGSILVDLVDIDSQNAVQSEEGGARQTTLPGTSTEVESKPIEDEVLVEDGNSKNQSINNTPMVADNEENGKSELDMIDGDKESAVPIESEGPVACCFPEVPEHSIEVEAMDPDSEKEEEEDEGDGLSFDFDDAEMDAVLVQSGETKPLEEDVEVADEVLADDLKADINNGELLVPSQNLENVSKALDIVDIESAAQSNDSSNEQRPTVEEAPQNSSENNNKSSCPVEEDAVSLQSNDSVKSREQGSANSEPPRSGKDAKKSSKKGKSKGKDECKMT